MINNDETYGEYWKEKRRREKGSRRQYKDKNRKGPRHQSTVKSNDRQRTGKNHHDWIGSVSKDFIPWTTPIITSPADDSNDEERLVGFGFHGFPVGVPSRLKFETINVKAIDYLCVLDFEATCGGKIPKTEQEVIEFPSVLVDVQDGFRDATVVSEFQRYVKPTLHPILHPSCTELTGITQETIDKDGIPFQQALLEHSHWLQKCLNEDDRTTSDCIPSIVFVTCGDWDLEYCLPQQLDLYNIPVESVPTIYYRWINIKHVYGQLSSQHKNNKAGMKSMLKSEQLPLIGHHHSGIDDCRNITNLLLYLMKSGADPGRKINEVYLQ